VRDALIWLGESDPCETMERMRGADPKLESLATVLKRWHAVIGEAPVTVRELIDRATDQRPHTFGKAEYFNPELREALLVVAGEGGAINSRHLGKWIGRHQNRIVGGRKIVSATVSAGSARWRIREVKSGDASILKVSDNLRWRADAGRTVPKNLVSLVGLVDSLRPISVFVTDFVGRWRIPTPDIPNPTSQVLTVTKNGRNQTHYIHQTHQTDRQLGSGLTANR
jgi:hypothetical protein